LIVLRTAIVFNLEHQIWLSLKMKIRKHQHYPCDKMKQTAQIVIRNQSHINVMHTYSIISYTDKNREKIMRKREQKIPNFLKMSIFSFWENWGKFLYFCHNAQLNYNMKFAQHNASNCVKWRLRFFNSNSLTYTFFFKMKTMPVKQINGKWG